MRQPTDAPCRLLEQTFVMRRTFLLVDFSFTELEPSGNIFLTTREFGLAPVCEIGITLYSLPDISVGNSENESNCETRSAS